jgi:hypothetical protein
MEQSLVFKKVSKNDVFIDNIFYGREVRFSFPCDQQSIEVEVHSRITKFSTELKLTIASSPCALLLEALPPLATFSKQFEGIDLLSLPEDIRLLAFQVATEAIQSHFSNILKTTITIDSMGTPISSEHQKGINFTLTSGQTFITAGTLVASREVLALLAKKIQKIPHVHSFKNLEMAYRVCVGSTRLSQEDYQNLCEEDIVFLDQYELARSKKVDIVGFDGLKIFGSLAPMGVVVEQIAE